MTFSKACALFDVRQTTRQETKFKRKEGKAYVLSQMLGEKHLIGDETRTTMNIYSRRKKKEQSPNHH